MANFGRPILHETNLQKVQWSTFNTTSMKSMGIAPPRHQRPRLEGEWSTRICANLDVSSSGEMGGWVGDHREGGNIEGMSSTWLPQGSKRRKVVEFVKKVMSSSLRQSQSERRSRDSIDQPSLLAMSSTAALPGGGWNELSHNYIFQAGFWGWFIAQFLKIFTKKYKTGIWDLRALIESGGMPSSHSALTAAVTTAVALEFGLGSSLFAVALCFTVITMYDAAGVRRHAGKQAEVLNVLLEDVLSGHPVSDRKLKEVLGHTPIQVVSGAILGVIVACFVPSPSNLPVV